MGSDVRLVQCGGVNNCIHFTIANRSPHQFPVSDGPDDLCIRRGYRIHSHDLVASPNQAGH
jgi:hypothetical protein